VTPITRVTATGVQEAAVALRREGVAVIAKLWDPIVIDDARRVVSAQHPEFGNPDELEDYLGDKHARFIAPVAITPALVDTGIFASRALEAVCEEMLSDAFVYEAFGVMVARPGAPAQEPHRDGGILFPDAAIDAILPPSALTLVIPLVDVTLDNGPTAAAPGSHRLQAGSSSAELVAMPVQRGDAAIWDFRTLHAGLANRTAEPRPVLYFTACRPFWTDPVNFRENARARLVGDPATMAALGPRFVRGREGSRR
jgi:hypothetical protein